jgi:transposase
MRFVSLKTMAQLDLQAIYRLRTRLVARRTAVINHMRGFLLERGVTFPIGREALVKRFPEVLDNPALGLSVRFLSAAAATPQRVAAPGRRHSRRRSGHS